MGTLFFFFNSSSMMSMGLGMGGIPSSLRLPLPSISKPFQLPPLSCLRNNNGDVNGLHEQRLEGAKNEDMSRFISDDEEQNVKHDNIWQLFREAQQNILYLNNQRRVAIEELNKTKGENQSLLNKIKKLEAEKQESADKESICSALLLRIDSMVLSNMIGPGEASELRSLVVNHKVSVADVFNVLSHKRDSELLGELRHFSDQSKKNGFHIIHICTEMAPLVAVPRGSIASYVTGLSRALQRKGHLVEVILPKYACLNLDEVQGLYEVNVEVYSYFNGQLHGNRIWTGVVCGIGVTLIEPLNYSSFFSRDMIYGYPDDFERFSYFCRASLDYIVKCGKKPDVLHLHNWETAIVGPLFWDIFVNKGLGGTRILLTCHGFSSQGIEQPDKLALCGLDPLSLHRPDRLQDNSNTQLVNILKGGVVYSNRAIIMSSIQPKSVIVRNQSHLEHTLNVHWDKLVIASYGLDKSTWDPSTDYFLPETFNAENMNGKAVCKNALLQQLGLSKHSSTLLVGCIFSEGADIDEKKMKNIFLNAKQHDVQFIFMGSSERPVLNQTLESLQKELKEDDLKFVLAYDEALSHLLFAGSDIILCQSFTDPTDETPLIALRYGAAPIAVNSNAHTNRTLVNHDQEATKYLKIINTTFGNMSLGLAIDEIRSNPSKWKQRIMEAMVHDFSWDGECYDIHVAAYSAIKNMLLAVFCVINLVNYVDRGAIASNGVNGSLATCTDSGICTAGTGIQGDFNLNNFQDGVLSSAFMVGLLIASPIFASLAKSHNPFRLIGVGLSVWTFAVAGCGSSFDFWSIAICRMLVGVGEASFISLAAPFIDDNAPVAQKTAWLATFYMCIPAGTALGYVYGGVVGSQFNWRVAFWGEAILMLPFSILGFVMKPLQLKGFAPMESKLTPTAIETNVSENGDDGVLAEDQAFIRKSKLTSNLSNHFTRFSNDMQELLHDRVYVINVLGYIAYNFVLGAYSYWGPKAGYNIYHMNNADLLFGGMTIVCGILGTLAGGLILDRITSTISNAFKILSGATFLGAIFCLVAFLFRGLSGYMVFFSIGEILLFATQAPVNYVSLRCVKPSLRPLSMAISTVSIHIFGDVPSAPLVGVLQDHLNDWRKTSLILTSIFFLAAVTWFIGIFLKTVDISNKDDEDQSATNLRGKREPLLEGSSDVPSQA